MTRYTLDMTYGQAWLLVSVLSRAAEEEQRVQKARILHSLRNGLVAQLQETEQRLALEHANAVAKAEHG